MTNRTQQVTLSQTAPQPEDQPPSLIKGILHMFLQAMIGAYALSVLLFLLAHATIGEQWVVIAFFNTFGHLLLLPAVVLLPVCLLLREWRLSILLLPAFTIFMATYGGQFIPIPREKSIPPDTPVLRVLTYNLLANNRPLEDSLNLIRSSDADIVALQEISTQTAPLLRAAFSDSYPYMALHPQPGDATAGQGILSRYPIDDSIYWRADWLRLRLGHQRAVIRWQEDVLVLYNIHTVHPGLGESFFDVSIRSREIDDILRRATAETDPVLIMGDFNMPDFTEDYDRVSARYADAFQRSGFGLGLTFRQPGLPVPPFLRLDYIFYDADALQSISARVLSHSGGSDHYPVLAELIRQ